MTKQVKLALRRFEEFAAGCIYLERVADKLHTAVNDVPLDDIDGDAVRRRFVRVRPMLVNVGRQLTEISNTIDPPQSAAGE